MITEKILVVDDEEIVCQSIKKILSRKGYEIDNALNVEDAVKKINQTSFDLVITDLMMPKTNGMELMQIIRDHYPELEVIMITGYASIESAVKATKLGASSYLPKPFTPDELAEATKKALIQRQIKIEQRKVEPKVDDQTYDIIDVDMPFNINEVAKATSIEYVEALTHTDIPLAKKTALKAYCNLGKRECRRVITEGRECVSECPLEKKERTKAVKIKRYTSEIIDVDLPFSISDVEQATSSDYINCLSRSDIPLAALWGRDATAKHSVLVVDDEPIVCHSVRRILSKQSCVVEEAFDVDAALQKMKLNRYDLILLDLKMPKRSGIEVLQSIKSNWPEIPVILISGYASIENAIEAIKLGASDIIPKPFTPAELTKKTQEVLVA
ncbi:MAG: response regulator [Bacteroidota bacterium]|nr:response regulator [Bacteroidota bacterium]